MFNERLAPELEAVLSDGFNPLLLPGKDFRHRPIVLTKIGNLDLQVAHTLVAVDGLNSRLLVDLWPARPSTAAHHLRPARLSIINDHQFSRRQSPSLSLAHLERPPALRRAGDGGARRHAADDCAAAGARARRATCDR